MVCPYCRVAFADTWQPVRDPLWETILVGEPPEKLTVTIALQWVVCPQCGRAVVQYRWDGNAQSPWATIVPRHAPPRPVPPEVESRFRSDFSEACLVLPLSPKASAALSRRCLQDLLREKAAVKPGNLIREIDDVVASGTLPSWLSGQLHAIRNVGNFAAHPIKDTGTGEIVDVEPGEAEWMLDLLEQLFDFYFVQPARVEASMKALNEKLASAGKPPMELEAPHSPAALPPGSEE